MFLSKDDQPVVFHDKALARLTGARGNVTARTAAELKKLYLRDGDGKTTAERIPTLNELLDAIGPRPGFTINIEIKDTRGKRVAAALAVLLKARLAAGWEPSHFLVSHFNTKILRIMRKAMPEIPIGALFGGARRPWDIGARALAGRLKEAQKLSAQTVNVTLPSLTDETVGMIRATGAQVLAWTCDEPDPEMLADRRRRILAALLLDGALDILITDYPGKMRAMLEAYR